MNTFRTVLFALPLVVAAALTGCASDPAGEDTADATGAASTSASAPITIANYVSHPKIKAVRDQVAAIEASRLTKATNPGCDGSNDKYTDASGKIRKLVTSGGEGGFEGRTTIYYNEGGIAIFVFNQEADWTGEKTDGATDKAFVKETRAYYTTQGGFLFQAMREGIAKGIDVGLQTADRLPTEDESWNDGEGGHSFDDPEAMFSSTGCAKQVEEPGIQ